MLKEEIEKIEEIENSVMASLKIENKIPSDEGKKITKEYLNGEITSSEAIEKIKKIYNL